MISHDNFEILFSIGAGIILLLGFLKVIREIEENREFNK
jgi:hypothetical protein